MVNLAFEFDLPSVLKSEWILVGSYAALKMIGYIVDKKGFFA